MKLPVAIKVIHDRTGRQTFNDLTDVRKHDLKDFLCMIYSPVVGFKGKSESFVTCYCSESIRRIWNGFLWQLRVVQRK